jgi:transposase
MEDLLHLYAEPYDPARPVLCFDECPVALSAATCTPLPAAPGRPQRVDYEYERRGSASLLGVFEPATGWRQVSAQAQRTRREVAEVWRAMVEDQYPEARRIRVVLDNVTTHSPAALFEVFEPARAWAIAAKLEWHYTPVHASWLNMIEIEWSVLARHCLRQRHADLPSLQASVSAWATERNAQRATVQWRFRAEDARERLATWYQAVRHDPS